MTSGNTDPIREPIRFQIGDTTYTLLTVAEKMYDESGEELLTRIDHHRRLFILSDRCRGRHAVLGALTMMLSAWHHQRGIGPVDYEQLSAVASVMERFLVDMGLEDAATRSLSSTTSISRPKKRWRSARRPLLIAALITISAGAWWSITSNFTSSDSSPNQTAIQTFTVSTPLPSLTVNKNLTTTSFPEAIGITAAHPVDPGFVVATADNEIRRIDLNGNARTLATTLAPVTWLSLSPDGQYIAACDTRQNFYFLSWDSSSPSRQWVAPNAPVSLSVDNNGHITWLDQQSAMFATDPISQTTTRLMGYEQAVSAGNGVAAYIRALSNRRSLEIQIDGHPLSLNVELAPNQLIHGLDTSDDHRTLSVILSDGLLLIFQHHGEGRYRLSEYQFPAPYGFARARLSRDGRTAIVVADQLYRLDTQSLRLTAQTPLPRTGGPVYDLAWRETFDEIAIARASEGAVWKP